MLPVRKRGAHRSSSVRASACFLTLCWADQDVEEPDRSRIQLVFRFTLCTLRAQFYLVGTSTSGRVGRTAAFSRLMKMESGSSRPAIDFYFFCKQQTRFMAAFLSVYCNHQLFFIFFFIFSSQPAREARPAPAPGRKLPWTALAPKVFKIAPP